MGVGMASSGQAEVFAVGLARDDGSRSGFLSEHGEFAVRGSLIDIFPMGSGQAIRIDFFDDDIESLPMLTLIDQCELALMTAVQTAVKREDEQEGRHNG